MNPVPLKVDFIAAEVLAKQVSFLPGHGRLSLRILLFQQIKQGFQNIDRLLMGSLSANG